MALRGIFKLWSFYIVMQIDFCYTAPSLMSHPLSYSLWTKFWEPPSSSSKKIFILEDRLKEIICFIKYYHTSANIRSLHLDDLIHVFVKVLALRQQLQQDSNICNI